MEYVHFFFKPFSVIFEFFNKIILTKLHVCIKFHLNFTTILVFQQFVQIYTLQSAIFFSQFPSSSSSAFHSKNLLEIKLQTNACCIIVKCNLYQSLKITSNKHRTIKWGSLVFLHFQKRLDTMYTNIDFGHFDKAYFYQVVQNGVIP